MTGAIGWDDAFGLEGENPWEGTIDDIENYTLHLKAERNAFKQAMDFFGIDLPENSGDRIERIEDIVNPIGQTITDYGVRNVDAMAEALASPGADLATLEDRARVLALNLLARGLSDNHNQNDNHKAHAEGLRTYGEHHFAHLMNKNAKDR